MDVGAVWAPVEPINAMKQDRIRCTVTNGDAQPMRQCSRGLTNDEHETEHNQRSEFDEHKVLLPPRLSVDDCSTAQGTHQQQPEVASVTFAAHESEASDNATEEAAQMREVVDLQTIIKLHAARCKRVVHHRQQAQQQAKDGVRNQRAQVAEFALLHGARKTASHTDEA